MRGKLLLAVAALTLSQRLAQWKPVDMSYHPETLSARERQMVEKLVEACRLLDDVYWRQSDLTGLNLYKTSGESQVKRMLMIMGSRWDLLDENRPFVGNDPRPPGHELYPKDLTRFKIEQYVAEHPADKDTIYDPFTVVKRQGQRLIGVKYHDEYKQLIQPMAAALREAAALS